MTHRAQLLTGIGIGFGLMYALDPERGRRRRAMLRDTVMSGTQALLDGMNVAGRDARNRLSGTAAQLRSRWEEDTADDQTVANRVRSKLGRLVSHPHAIAVTVDRGVATLSGPILQAEVGRVLRGVEHVRGVREVVNQLEEHETAGSVPALQGGRTLSGGRMDVLQRPWAPATRMATSSSGR